MLKLTPLDQSVAVQEFIRQTTKENMMEALEIRLGRVPKRVAEAIEALDDLAVLKKLYTQAILADSLAAFEQALPA